MARALILFLLFQGTLQFTPITLNIDRTWHVKKSDAVGTKIATIKLGYESRNQNPKFSIESPLFHRDFSEYFKIEGNVVKTGKLINETGEGLLRLRGEIEGSPSQTWDIRVIISEDVDKDKPIIDPLPPQFPSTFNTFKPSLPTTISTTTPTTTIPSTTHSVSTTSTTPTPTSSSPQPAPKEEASEVSSSSPWTIFAIISSLALILLGAIGATTIILKKRRKPKQGIKPVISNVYTTAANGGSVNSGVGGNSLPDPFEVDRNRIRFLCILGEGCFGQVWKCELLSKESASGGKSELVAVKTLKNNAGERERCDLISEMGVMKGLEQHNNVVKLLGCCSQGEPLYLIMEYVAEGTLQSFLRKSRASHDYGNLHSDSVLTSKDLTSFAYQVAKGMQFLSERGIIHRDLAARNVLLDADKTTCKVADFGFARDLEQNSVYERKSDGRLPIRWMSPESLFDNQFTSSSDVWSFGILMWEIVTLGSTPYPGLGAAEVLKKIQGGYRLEKPEHCRRELYNIMFYCWEQNPLERPSFKDLVKLLGALLSEGEEYIMLDLFPEHLYYNFVNDDEKV